MHSRYLSLFHPIKNNCIPQPLDQSETALPSAAAMRNSAGKGRGETVDSGGVGGGGVMLIPHRRYLWLLFLVWLVHDRLEAMFGGGID